MTNTLPGNPHAADAARTTRPMDERLIDAQLAIAWETRTNTMATLACIDPSFYGSTSRDEFEAIDARLGQEPKAAGDDSPQPVQDEPQPGHITIPDPFLPAKAEGSRESEYLIVAAARLRANTHTGGSGVRNMLADLAENAADALKRREVGE
ncbi:hypothetical protein [Arthrobacter sp. UYCu712]|uniref:hypothetical protein n=1 Tax=Arthrobacter sp. UYCu712 TaxID=3156340 RepID=UPI003391A95A